jgi:hypothetical protein
MDDPAPKKERACSHCGRLESEHALVNFADGPQIGQPVLVCPRSIFKAVRE